MQPAATGTDQRLDKMSEQLNAITAQNDRQIEQLGQIIDIGLEAIAAIKALLPDEPRLAAASPDAASAAIGQLCDLREPARKRKKP